jgi:glycerophosphoryl diester phosphodiesterase
VAEKNTSHRVPLIIAHRGFSDEAPENSVASFQKAIEAKCDMLELDVRLSSDNIPIIFHDRRLQRTSSSRGNVNDKSANELSEIDNGSWFSPKFNKERIPLLGDILPLLKKDITLNIEIKPDIRSTNGSTVAEIIVQEVRKAKALSKVIFTSFNHNMVKEVKQVDDSLTTGVIYNPITHFRKSPSLLLKSVKADIFVSSKLQINKDVVADTHNSGYKLYVYGIKTGRDVERMLEFGIDGLICNNPRFVRETVELLRR